MWDAASCLVCFVIVVQDPYQALAGLVGKDARVERGGLVLYCWHRPELPGTDSNKKAKAEGIGLVLIIQNHLLSWVSCT